jgi:hypothetical protein
MRATPSSIDSPALGVTVTLKRTIAVPAAAMVSVCPSPQNAPTSAPEAKRFVRLTMLATATTWSASVACWSPKTKPSASAPRLESI